MALTSVFANYDGKTMILGDIADEIIQFLEFKAVPEDVAILLEKYSRKVFHRCSVQAVGTRLPGNCSPVQYSEPDALHNPFKDAYDGRFSEIGVYQRAIVGSISISTKTSASDR